MARKVKQPHGGELHILEKGETANPNGRPPVLMTKITRSLKEAGYKRVAAAEMEEHLSILLNIPMSEVERLADDESTPLATRIICDHLLNPKDRLTLLSDLMDRAHGRAKQSVDVAATVATPAPVIQLFPPDGTDVKGG